MSILGLNKFTFLSSLIVVNTFLFNNQFAYSLTTKEVNNIAQKVVVGIVGEKVSNSGIIITKSDNIYGVLTIWQNLQEEGNYQVLINKKLYSVIEKKQIANSDLGIIYFKSEEVYPLAKFGNSKEINLEDEFYLAGFSVDDSQGKKPAYRFYNRKLVKIQSDDNSPLIFEGVGLPGMLGSAIFNSNGRLIGIYSKTDINSETLQANLWVIPINTVEKLAKSDNLNFDRNLAITKLKPIPIEENLISDTTKVNYTTLRNLLAAQRWKEADKVTLDLMLNAVNRQEEGWFTKENADNFPCDDYKLIDNLWRKYSNDRFGFKTQENIYLETGNNLVNYDRETYLTFGDRLGWINNDVWIAKNNFIFNQNAPIGHLPMSASKRIGVYLGLFFSSCKV